MTPFQEELYRLVQNIKKSQNPFSSEAQEAGTDINQIIAFAEKWDFKAKYEALKEHNKNALTLAKNENKLLTVKAVRKLTNEFIPIVDQAYAMRKYVEPDTDLARGLNVIISNMEEIFTRNHGQVIVPVVGEDLDPSLHKAVEAEQSNEFAGTRVAEVYRYGYSIMGVILRPAEVKVVYGTR